MPSVRGELNYALNVSRGTRPDGRGSSPAVDSHECGYRLTGPFTTKLHGKSVNVAKIYHIFKMYHGFHFFFRDLMNS